MCITLEGNNLEESGVNEQGNRGSKESIKNGEASDWQFRKS